MLTAACLLSFSVMDLLRSVLLTANEKNRKPPSSKSPAICHHNLHRQWPENTSNMAPLVPVYAGSHSTLHYQFIKPSHER